METKAGYSLWAKATIFHFPRLLPLWNDIVELELEGGHSTIFITFAVQWCLSWPYNDLVEETSHELFLPWLASILRVPLWRGHHSLWADESQQSKKGRRGGNLRSSEKVVRSSKASAVPGAPTSQWQPHRWADDPKEAENSSLPPSPSSADHTRLPSALSN